MAKLQYKYRAFAFVPGELTEELSKWGKKGYRLSYLLNIPDGRIAVVMEKVKKKK